MKTTWPKFTYPVRPVMKFKEYASAAKIRRLTKIVNVNRGIHGANPPRREGTHRCPITWARLSATSESSPEDPLRAEQKDRDQGEEGDCCGKRRTHERLPDVNDYRERNPADEAPPHPPRSPEDHDHETDGGIEGAHAGIDPHRQPHREEGS